MEAAHIVRVAWRSLFRNPRRTAITVSSIGFGLAISLFLVSMTAGIHRKAMEDGVRTIPGHLMIEHPAYALAPGAESSLAGVEELRRLALAVPGVSRTTAVALAQAMASTGAGSAGVTLVGIEPGIEVTRSPIPSKLVQGRYLTEEDDAGALVGARLAERLKLSIGKKLVLTSADLGGDLSSELVRVTGIFRTGAEEADGFLVQVHLASARRLLGLGADQASQVGVVLASPDDQPMVQAALEESLRGRGVMVQPWQDVMPELSGWMEVDRRFTRVMEFIILFLIAFTILNTLLMSAVERHREFAVLLALGTPPSTLRAQILVEAALLGALGCAFGLAVGCGGSLLAQVHGIDLTMFVKEAAYVGGIALERRVHNDLRLTQVLVLSGTVYLCTVLIGLYPMLKSTQVEVASLLRTR
ncbi:MAG: ABC transporter permease [Myxococcaceae bacterium]